MCAHSYNYGILILKSDKTYNLIISTLSIKLDDTDIKHLLLAKKHLIYFLSNHLNIKEKSKCNENDN
jgi:hypothetical protein